MGLFKVITSILGLLALAIIGLGAYLYFTDYAVEGTIVERGSDANGSYVVVSLKTIPRDVQQSVDANAARFLCEGYEVSYRVQSQFTEVRDRNGRPIYNSDDGLLLDPLNLTDCSRL